MATDELTQPAWSDLSYRVRQRITLAVFEAKGRTCTLRLPGCTVVAKTVDHSVPSSRGGPHTVANLEPACRHCNQSRGTDSTGGDGRYGATVRVVIGPPCAGKREHVAAAAGPGDLVIDPRRLALALVPAGVEVLPAHVRQVAGVLVAEATHAAARLPVVCTVWLIDGRPSPSDLAGYRRRGWLLVPVDPGETVVRSRTAGASRTVSQAVNKWYAGLPGLAATDGSQTATRRAEPSRAW